MRIAAAVEAASLALLFLNLFTVHLRVITSLVGPLHGTAYLVTIGAACMAPAAAGSGARWRAAVPGIGGLLAVARLRGRPAPASPAVDTAPGGPRG
ncbi:hypothetical protein ADL00_07565 [Streptomyces sp. AS58]|nr:hypothetical protein ADL00_07565 [Streptomyces sp. AS58]